ncbi:MAG: Gfo/Idh/MocA family protein [Candidatus Bathyarchaeia archaeon]
MKRVKVGVIGSGGIFQIAHLPAYPDVEEAKLVALCDISEDALKTAERRTKKIYLERATKAEEDGKVELAEQLREDVEEIRTYKSVEEMISKEEIDLADICTPTKFHNPLAITTLKSGVNVMVEKPMARTYLECLDVVEAVKDSGKLYQHNENWLYDPIWYNVKKLIESGVIGELQLVFVATAHGGPEWASWFWDPEIAGGGALLDNGVHAITASWFLNGFEKRPTVVKAAEPYGICIRMKTRVLQGMFKPFVVEDDAHVLIRYEDESGAWSTAHVEGSWSHRDSMETRMVGTNGEIQPSEEDEEWVLRIVDAFGRVRKIPLGKRSWIMSFPGEIRNMCNCVINGVKPLCDENIGAETTAIVQAAYLSQKRGKKAVTLDEFKDYALRLREKEGKDAPKELLKDLLEAIKVYSKTGQSASMRQFGRVACPIVDDVSTQRTSR